MLRCIVQGNEKEDEERSSTDDTSGGDSISPQLLLGLEFTRVSLESLGYLRLVRDGQGHNGHYENRCNQREPRHD